MTESARDGGTMVMSGEEVEIVVVGWTDMEDVETCCRGHHCLWLCSLFSVIFDALLVPWSC